MSDMDKETNDKAKLKKYVTAGMNRVLHDVLCTIQTLSKSEYQYTAIRSQVLRTVNDFLRDTCAEIDTYHVEAGEVKRTRKDTYDVE